MCRLIAIVVYQRRIVEQRLTRVFEGAKPFREIREQQQHIGIDRESLRRLPQRLLGALWLARERQRPSVEPENLAARQRLVRNGLERFERFSRIGGIAVIFGGAQPHLAER